MRHLRPLFIATALSITPVAHAQDAAAQAQPAAPAEAPAAAAASSALIPAPQAGKGQVVFFREKKFVGAAMSYKVREGETELGKLSNGSYLVLEVEPGTHQYHMQGETKDVLTLEVEAGETYYVQGGISMGVLAGRPNLSPSDQAAFEAMAPKLKKR
ncbi:DUF2846 domain-containing protein [Thermomonas mangrovi]|uniref:DUF2846 domain-containing protein n=1 Tax=Thermomonas mangrovi TaxID=2993316 RepID=UPI002307F28C|nr:DUF2846 domain-containing protein [Thermomonas mangrovi]